MITWSKALVSLLCIVLFLNVKAGDIDDIKNVLKKKNYSSLKNQLGKISKNKNRNSYFPIDRELVSGFLETKIKYEESYPDKDNPSVSTVVTYYLHILRNNDKIFYYKLIDYRHSNAPKNVLYYKDKTVYNSLEKLFKTTFQSTIDSNHLFTADSQDITYGSHCGIVGRDPEYRVKLDKAVLAKDTSLLKKWLSSTYVELQVYGVDGFYQLKQKGLAPSPKVLKMIEAIKHKKDEIITCSGCMYFDQEIVDVTQNFKF